MAIPFANRTVIATIPDLALQNRPKFTLDEVQVEFASLFTTPLKDTFQCIQRIARNQLRFTFRDAALMEDALHVGLTFRQYLLTIMPISNRKWVRIERLPYGTPQEVVRAALSAFGPVSKVRLDEVRGISNGEFSLLMEVTKEIPSKLSINGHMAYVFYRGQKRTCFRCGKEGHTIQHCPGPKQLAPQPAAAPEPIDTTQFPPLVVVPPIPLTAIPPAIPSTSFAQAVQLTEVLPASINTSVEMAEPTTVPLETEVVSPPQGRDTLIEATTEGNQTQLPQLPLELLPPRTNQVSDELSDDVSEELSDAFESSNEEANDNASSTTSPDRLSIALPEPNTKAIRVRRTRKSAPPRERSRSPAGIKSRSPLRGKPDVAPSRKATHPAPIPTPKRKAPITPLHNSFATLEDHVDSDLSGGDEDSPRLINTQGELIPQELTPPLQTIPNPPVEGSEPTQ